jgi:hypothetical protein
MTNPQLELADRPNPTLGSLSFQFGCFFEFFESGHGAGGVVCAFPRFRTAVAFGSSIML